MQVSFSGRRPRPTTHPGDRSAVRALIVAAALVLGGCEATISVAELNPFGDSEPPPCPDIAALADASSLVEFGRTDSTDETNIRYRAEITQNAFACTVEGDRVSGPITIAGSVELGRKGKAGNITLPMFVALTRDEAEVIDKRFDTIEVVLERGQTRANFSKVNDGYSFDLVSGADNADYGTRTGSSLTPEQIDHNRRFFGR